MIVDTQIWSNEGLWPYDQADHVFILRAVGKVGKSLFSDVWTDRERISWPATPLPLWYDAKEGDRQLAIALLRSHPNEPQAKLVTEDAYSGLKPIRVKPGVVVDHRPREQYEAARDISLKLYREAVPAKKRLETVIETMAAWLRSGELVSALRPQAGGAMGEPLPATVWQTERWRLRFFCGQMDPSKVFETAPRGSSNQWLYLTRDSLNARIKPTVGAGENRHSLFDVLQGPGRPRGTGFPFDGTVTERADRIYGTRKGYKADSVRLALAELRGEGQSIPNQYDDPQSIDRIRRKMDRGN